jgi:hypothetical protein
MVVIRKYTASDGTQMIVYEDNTGYQNTVPLYIYNKLIKNQQHGHSNSIRNHQNA